MRRLLAFILLIACALVVPAPQTASAAVEPEITLTLIQDRASSRLDAALELTAEVEVLVGAEELEWGVWYVEFTGTADGGWSSGAIATDDGEARYVRPASTVETAQTETITATLVSEGCNAITDEVEHLWYIADDIELALYDGETRLDPAAEGSNMYYVDVGTEVTLAARLTRRGTAVPGVELLIQNDDGEVDKETDSSGIARESWTGTESGAEAVTVTEPTGTDPLEAQLEIDWLSDEGGQPGVEEASAKPTVAARKPPEPRLRVAAVGPRPAIEVELRRSVEDPDARVGTEVTWSAEVFLRGQNERPIPIQNIKVTFSESGGGWTETADTAANGLATLPAAKTSDTARIDTVTASVVFDECGTFVSEPLAFEWWEPELTLAPLDATSEAGKDFALTATLTQSNGGPINGSRLELTAHSTQCTLDDLTDVEFTDEKGVAVFTVRRDVPATDLITVAERPAGDIGRVRAAAALASATSTHTWTPAIAPNIAVDLQQDAPNGRIGSNVTVTATVTRAPSEESPGSLEGIPVTFSGFDGDDVVQKTDREAKAKFSYSRPTPGIDQIVAAVPYGCSTVSDAVDHEWWVPTLSLTPRDTTTPAGEDVEFTAALQHSPNNTPLAEQELTFTLHSSSCTLPDETRAVRTGPDGRARVTFSRSVPSRDTITVFESGIEVASPQSDATGHIWGVPDPLPIQVRLRQSNTNGRIGERITLAARVTVTDTKAPKPETVQFIINGQPTGPTKIDNGVARYRYTRTTVGTDQLSATTTYGCDVIRSNELKHRWWRPELTLAPANGTSTVGESASLTATLREGTRVLRERRIRLTVRDDVSVLPARSITVRTDPRGRATLPLRRPTPGIDRITAVELAQPDPASASALHTWIAAPDIRRLTLVATPATGEAEVGGEHTVVAVTEFGGDPQEGVEVRFTADKPDESQREGTDVSGPLGQTFFTFRRQEPGTDQIVVTATFRNQTVSQTVTHEWTEKLAKPKLTLRPDNTSSQVGEEFNAIAVVEQDGAPEPGVRVNFVSELADEKTTDSVETDAEGQAQFSYVRDEPGDDLITATANVDGEPLTAEISHTWIGEEPPESKSPPSVTPGSASGRPGGDLSLSGTGCAPGELVVVFISGEEVGRTIADGDGNYQLRVPVPKLPLGQHVIRATCGSVSTTNSIDINLPQSNGSAAAAGATTGAVLLFFVLLANALMHGMRGRFD